MLRTSRRHDSPQAETPVNSRYFVEREISTPPPKNPFESAFGAGEFVTIAASGSSFTPLSTASAPVTPHYDDSPDSTMVRRVRNSPRSSLSTSSTVIATPRRSGATRVRSLSTPFLQPLLLPAPLNFDDLDDSEDSTTEDISTDTIRPTTGDSARTRKRFSSTPEKLRSDIELPVETESAVDTEPSTSEESSYESAEEGSSPIVGRENSQRRSQDGFEGFLSLPGSRPNSLTSAFDAFDLSPRIAEPLLAKSLIFPSKPTDREESDITFETFLESTRVSDDTPTLSSENGSPARHSRTMSRDSKRNSGFRNPTSFNLALNADGISPTQATFPTNVQSPLAANRSYTNSRPFTDPWAISTGTLPFPKSTSLPRIGTIEIPEWKPETPRERLRSSTSTIHSSPPRTARTSTPSRSRPTSLTVTPTLILPDPAAFARSPGPTQRPSEIPLARRRISSFFGLGLPKELLVAEAPRVDIIRRSTFPLASITPSPIVAETWKSTLDLVEYERLLAKHGAGEMKRQEVIYELCQTERAFVASMGSVVKVFALPMRTSSGSWSVGTPSNFRRLFDWLDDIIMVHQQISLALTNQRKAGPMVEKFADSFLPLVKRLAVHQPYLVQFEKIVKEIEGMTKDLSSEFGKYLRARSSAPECERLSLSSFLLKPVQRLCKYPLFFKQLCDLTPSAHSDHLPTLRLLHSTDLIIRATQKVKIEEDNYVIAKNVVSRIIGLPEGYELAHRDRQLIAHGGLVRVHVTESHQELLRQDSLSRQRLSASDSDSSLNSVTTMTRSSTDSSSELDYPGTPGSISRAKRDQKSLSSSSSGSTNPLSTKFAPELLKNHPRRVVKTKAKETALHLFVFSDLIVLTTPSSRRSSKSLAAEDKIVYKVVELAKLVQITDLSGKTEHDHLIQLDLILYPTFTKRKTIFITLPPLATGTTPSALSIFKERSRWLQSFERSSRGSPRSRPSSANSTKQPRTLSTVLIDSKGIDQSEIDEREWWATRLSVVLTELEVGPELETVITLPGKRISTGSRRESGEVKLPRVLRSTRSSRSLKGELAVQ